MTHIDKAREINDRLAPQDGWWKFSTELAVVTVATNLLAAGANESVVERAIETLIQTMREEYGE